MTKRPLFDIRDQYGLGRRELTARACNPRFTTLRLIGSPPAGSDAAGALLKRY
jgi:hypothetical protein